jgi:hypothetical protein
MLPHQAGDHALVAAKHDLLCASPMLARLLDRIGRLLQKRVLGAFRSEARKAQPCDSQNYDDLAHLGAPAA